MFLVVLRHAMDDLPIRLFETMDDAVAFARRVKGTPTARIRRVFECDGSTPCSVAVVEFSAPGDPVRMDTVKWFGDGNEH